MGTKTLSINKAMSKQKDWTVTISGLKKIFPKLKRCRNYRDNSPIIHRVYSDANEAYQIDRYNFINKYTAWQKIKD